MPEAQLRERQITQVVTISTALCTCAFISTFRNTKLRFVSTAEFPAPLQRCANLSLTQNLWGVFPAARDSHAGQPAPRGSIFIIATWPALGPWGGLTTQHATLGG